MDTLFSALQVYLMVTAVTASEEHSRKGEAPDKDNAAGYEGAQVFQIRKTPNVLYMIKKEGFDIWSANETFCDIMVPKDKIGLVKDVLSKNEVSHSVKISDLADKIKKVNPPAVKTKMRTYGGRPIDIDTYNTLEDIYNYMDYLEENYKLTVEVNTIGYTYNRLPIKYIKVSSGVRDAKTIFIEGGIHAREWISPASVVYILNQLVENRVSIPHELLDVDFYILPVLNPDGYEYTHKRDRMWRKNRSGKGKCKGTDLNRNFHFHFGEEGTSDDPCSGIYRGAGPASEWETKALTAFILDELREKLDAYIAFHSYGQFILVPYGYTSGAYPKDFAQMKRVANKVSYAMRQVRGGYYKAGNTARLMYPAAGGSDDWTKANTNAAYVYCIELADTGKHGFILPPEEILPTGQEAFEAIRVIASEIPVY